MSEHFSGAHSQANRVAVMLQLFGRHGFKHLRDSPDIHSLMQLVEQASSSYSLLHRQLWSLCIREISPSPGGGC